MNNEVTKDNESQEPEAVANNQNQENTASQEVEGTAETQEELLSVDEARIAELESALAAAEAKVEEQKDSVLRAKAESENVRRRAETEVDKARKFALERFAGELLPVIDNLERALQSSDTENEASKAMYEGVEITLKSFVSTIEKFGMSVVDPQGQAFNPELHQAMSMQESAEVAPNTVIAVMQKGYQLNGRLLRPAMVAVSRAASNGVDVEA